MPTPALHRPTTWAHVLYGIAPPPGTVITYGRIINHREIQQAITEARRRHEEQHRADA